MESANARQPIQSRRGAPRRRRPDRPVDPDRVHETAKTFELQSRSTEKVSPILPPPKFLAKKPTQPRNDPLWLEADVITGEYGLSCDRAIQSFDADAAGYTTLVEEEYNAIIDQDKNFAKSVSLSAYQYFHTMLYWYKGALLAEKSGIARPIERDMISALTNREIVVPAGAAAYLSGMGDFDDDLGTHHQMFMKKPNAEGTFGRVANNTHGYYETLPAPAIAIQRVLEDHRFTTGRDANPHWDIPGLGPRVVLEHRLEDSDDDEPGEEERPVEGMDPLEEDDGRPENEPLVLRPTANLLGWRLARRLERNQLSGIMDSFCDEVPISYRDLTYVVPDYCLHDGLFNFVGRKISGVKPQYIIPGSPTGLLIVKSSQSY